jgi:hypothetical protein
VAHACFVFVKMSKRLEFSVRLTVSLQALWPWAEESFWHMTGIGGMLRLRESAMAWSMGASKRAVTALSASPAPNPHPLD